MTTLASQKSFAGGEIDPQLWGRTDLAKYQIGLVKCLNWLVNPGGSCSNRAGTVYVATTKGAGTGRVRLIKSVRDASTAYVLEFGHLYVRVFKNDALQIEIVSPYSDTDLAGLQYVQSIDVITITHPLYAPRELKRTSDTDWAFTEPSYGPTRAPPVAGLTLTAGVPRSGGYIYNPTSVVATGGNAGLDKDYYVVSTASPFFESTASDLATSTVGGADAGNHVTLTWVSGPLGYANRIYKYLASTGRFYRIAEVPIGTTTYTDTGVVPSTSSFQPATSPPSLTTFTYKITSIDDKDGTESEASSGVSAFGGEPSVGSPNLLSWSQVIGASEYNVYRSWNGVDAFVGTARGSGVVQFRDPLEAGSGASTLPDVTTRPPNNKYTFAADGDYPSAVCYFEQRLCFAGSVSSPEYVWMSGVGAFHNFAVMQPVTDDGTVAFELNSLRANPVRWMLDLGVFTVFTDQGVWVLQGNSQGVVTPSAPNARRVNAIGASGAVRPLVVNNSALYLQALGGAVRDLRFDLQTNGYNGDEVSLLAQHLFLGHTIVAWDYAEIPGSMVWAARDDGLLLAMTYLPSQQVYAWHEHDVGGVVEDVCCIPGAREDVLYLLVNRTINGATVRCIERMASRLVTNLGTDAHFVDAGLVVTPQVTNVYGPWTLTITGGTTWLADDFVSIQSSAAIFVTGGNFTSGQTLLLRFGTTILRVLLTGFGTITGTNHIAGKLLDAVPLACRNVATNNWIKSTDPGGLVSSATLAHLVGKTVIGLADGNVIGPFVVPHGGVVNLGLESPAMCVHIGLPIAADWQMLDPPDVPGLKRKRNYLVQQARVRFFQTRGVKGGVDFGHLRGWEPDQPDFYNTALATFTGQMDIELDAMWQRQGGVCLRQDQPLPATICAVELVGVNAGD